MNNEIYERYPNKISEEKLAKRFGLYWHKNEQDWELIVSNHSRISDFLKVYQTELDNEDDKFTLMGLIISSFDDGISKNNKEIIDNWSTCKIILEKENFLHYSIIKYWSLLDTKSDDLFNITPYMREVWNNVKTKFL